MALVRALGRPRDAGIDEAILLATWDQLNQVGYTSLTMTAVAEAAGIQKPALYRRWPTKPMLVIDALARHLPSLTYPDLHSLPADLEHVLAQLAAAWRTPAARRSFSPLLADIATDDAALTSFRERVLRPRGSAVQDALRNAVERGELRGDGPLDVVADMLEGPLMHRAMLGEGAIDNHLLDNILASCLALLHVAAKGSAPG